MQCGYCDQNQENLLATCLTCHQHFCNTNDKPASLSHILKHLKETQHNQFSVPAIGELRCEECGRCNILDLFKDQIGNIFCREHQVADYNQIVLGKKIVDIFDQDFTNILPDVNQGIQLQDKTDGTCSDGKYQEMEYIDGQDQIWQAEGDNSPEVESPPGINTKDVTTCSDEQGQQINSEAPSIITTADSIIIEMRLNEEKQRFLVGPNQQDGSEKCIKVQDQLKKLKGAHTKLMTNLRQTDPNHELIVTNYSFDEVKLPSTEEQVYLILVNMSVNEDQQRFLLRRFNQATGVTDQENIRKSLLRTKATHTNLMNHLKAIAPDHNLVLTNYTFDKVQIPQTSQKPNATKIAKSTPPAPPTLPQPLSADLVLAEKIKQLVSKIQLPAFVKVTELNKLIGLKVQNTTKVAKSYITDTLEEPDISDYEELATNVLSMLGIDLNELQPKSQVVQPSVQGKKQPVQDKIPDQKKKNQNKVQEPVKRNKNKKPVQEPVNNAKNQQIQKQAPNSCQQDQSNPDNQTAPKEYKSFKWQKIEESIIKLQKNEAIAGSSDEHQAALEILQGLVNGYQFDVQKAILNRVKWSRIEEITAKLQQNEAEQVKVYKNGGDLDMLKMSHQMHLQKFQKMVKEFGGME